MKDIFGKSGVHPIWGLLNKAKSDDIIITLPSARVKKKADILREILSGSLSDLQIILIKRNLDIMAHINEHSRALDEPIIARMTEQDSIRDVEIACSIPGISVTSAVTILAEMRGLPRFRKCRETGFVGGIGAVGIQVRKEKLFRKNH